jgi:hypothetical protein
VTDMTRQLGRRRAATPLTEFTAPPCWERHDSAAGQGNKPLPHDTVSRPRRQLLTVIFQHTPTRSIQHQLRFLRQQRTNMDLQQVFVHAADARE